MLQKLQVVLLVTVLTLVKSQTNYCSLPSCLGSTHTMCRFPSADPVSKCKKLTTSNLTAEEKRTILEIHNRLRQKVAAGSETRGNPGPQPASTNMPDLVWDDELAMIAQRWSNQCDYGHDICRDVARFRVGQNVALYPNRVNVIETIMDDFYNEVTLFNKAEVSRFLGMNLQDIGHYTQIVWGSTTKVGCGATRFVAFNNVPYFYLVCNYGPAGNVFYEPVYQTR